MEVNEGVIIMNRRTTREKAMQIIFQMDMNEMNPEKAIKSILSDEPIDHFLETLVQGVALHREELDQIIRTHLENWSFERIANVEKAVLRIAVYELEFMEDIPKKVSIHEAVELAKKYGDEKSGPFVNGVLSKIIEKK